jgi:O-antigen ligase
MRFFILIPILAAFAFLEVFLGGARLLYGVSGVALVAIASLFTALPGTKTSQRVDILTLASSLLFAAYIVLRNRFSEVEYIGRLQLFILIGSLMIYLLFTLVLTRPLDRKRLFVFLGILALLQMIPAIVQFTQGNQWMPFPWSQRQDHSWRASGLFISPNNFAGFVEIIALFAASFTIWGRMKILTRVLLGYIALVCIVGVAISGSRGGYLSLVFGSGVLLLLTLIAWHRMKREHFQVAAIVSVIAALVLFAGILLVVFLSPNLGGRVMQINDPENPRLILWPAALHQFQLSPIWGTGRLLQIR